MTALRDAVAAITAGHQLAATRVNLREEGPPPKRRHPVALRAEPFRRS